MPDREKVMKWLDVCKTADRAVGLKEDYPCRECPYKGSPRCIRELVADALALLKEQEAVEPRVSTVEQRCGNCNKVIEMDGWITCPWCGKPIKWEGR